MKEYLQELVRRSKTTVGARLIMREYLQARVLEALQRGGAFGTWAFLGGTALRFLYRLPRFFEDLDFSRTGGGVSRVRMEREFQHLMNGIQRTFEAEVYQVDIRSRTDAVVHSAFIGFPGLLHEFGLAPHVDQKISIKVEVDTNPPENAGTQRSVCRSHALLNLFHYDKASLLSGKLHALIQRPYVKGRDVYDLVWYLSDSTWPAPNLPLLQASLAKTGMELSDTAVGEWRKIVSERIAAMDWARVVADVEPFLERSEEIELLTRENVLGLLNA